jgi:hypothetical protein
MMRAVIDTNVLSVANGQHAEVSPDCVSVCTQRLLEIKQSGIAVIDDGYRILGEYGKGSSPNSPKGAGDVFLKWLLQNQSTPRVEQVAITETSTDFFPEFPEQTLQEVFDPSDRKFVAVANVHPDKPPVWQAADSKWLDWWPALQANGVRVEFLCPDDICQFYRKKFPQKTTPALPE